MNNTDITSLLGDYITVKSNPGGIAQQTQAKDRLSALPQWSFIEKLLQLQIGGTELLRIKTENGAQVYIKEEYSNFSGSVKDRVVEFLLLEQILLRNINSQIIEATSGNTGISFVTIGKILGISVDIVLPANASEPRKEIISKYANNLYLTDKLEGTEGSVEFVEHLRAGRLEDAISLLDASYVTDNIREAIAAKDPREMVYPDQYNNPFNWMAHYLGTGPEIWEQTDGKITHWVAGIGTGGTFGGTARYLKEQNVNVQCIAVQPSTPLHGMEGLKHLSSVTIPEVYQHNIEYVDQMRFVDPEKAADFNKQASYLGPSGAANLYAALEVAKQAPKESIIVTVAPDKHNGRY